MTVVLHAIDYAPQRPGSFIRAIENLVASLKDACGAHSVVVIPSEALRAPWTQQLRSAGADVVGTVRPGDLARTIRAANPQVIHTHFNGYIVSATLAALTRDCRVYWHVHSALPQLNFGVKRALRHMKFGMLARRTEKLFAVSGELADTLVREGVPESRIRIIENGIDVEYFRPPSLHERASARAALGLSGRERAVLFFGRDAHVKGADVLAAALSRSNERMTLLCADAPASVIGLFDRTSRILDLGPLQDVRRVLWAADLLAMPSRLEGLPLGLLEARATELPAAVSSIAAFDAFAAQDEGTVQARGNDAPAFAEALQTAARLTRAPLNGGLRRRYSVQRWCEHVLEAYGAL